jgi:serine/threonine protein kinase
MQPGTRLGNGRWVVRGVLGEGAQGTTYDALDEESGRPVAIKRFDVRGAKSWKDVELAEREARVLATIDHPLVPRYVAHFEESGSLFLVMEKVEGESVEAIRGRTGPLPEADVRRFLTCADRALSYLHGRAAPIVHRDIKPRNVIRREDGSFVFVDFGTVAELLSRRSASTVVGTIGFMAPEQLQGRAMPATDVYAVGATAVAALTGADPDTLPHRGLALDVRSALAGRASEAMIASLERMLEPDPERRASSVAAALEWGAAPAAPVKKRATLANEDAAVKSLRNLLWLLWGLGWVVLPLLVKAFDLPKVGIPLLMFGSLASLFILTWHKGALLRAIMRRVIGIDTDGDAHAHADDGGAVVRRRVDIGEAGKVRVHADRLEPEEVLGETELPARRALSGRS